MLLGNAAKYPGHIINIFLAEHNKKESRREKQWISKSSSTYSKSEFLFFVPTAHHTDGMMGNKHSGLSNMTVKLVT